MGAKKEALILMRHSQFDRTPQYISSKKALCVTELLILEGIENMLFLFTLDCKTKLEAIIIVCFSYQRNHDGGKKD